MLSDLILVKFKQIEGGKSLKAKPNGPWTSLRANIPPKQVQAQNTPMWWPCFIIVSNTVWAQINIWARLMSDRDRPKTHRVLLFAILLVGILGVASLLEIHPLPKKIYGTMEVHYKRILCNSMILWWWHIKFIGVGLGSNRLELYQRYQGSQVCI